MIERLLHWIADQARHRYRAVFAVLAILVVLCVGLMTRLRFDTEVLNLLPQDDPVVKTFRETLEEFGSLDFLLVVVRVPEDQVVDPYLAFTEQLGRALEQRDDIEYVDYHIGEVEQLVEDFFPQSLLFLDRAGREQVAERLTEEGIRDRVREMRRILQTPQGLAYRELLIRDPLGISEVFMDRIVGGRGPMRVDWTSGYFLSQDRSLVLLVAKPTLPAQEIDFARKLLAGIEDEVTSIESRWAEISGVLEGEELPPMPSVDFGGTYATAVSDAGSLARDIITNAVTSMVGVLLLFYIAFRRIGVIGYAFVPLASGLVLAVGFAAGTVGLLNAITSSFAALLVGLGIDFVIVSYGRYVEERRRGRSLEQALRGMTGSSGRAVVTGGLTTAATFYSFGITEFTGLRQMGYLVGTGILFCMVAVLVVLPALLAWSEDRHHRKNRRVRRHLHGFGSARLVRLSWKHPAPVLVGGAILTLVAGWAALDLKFVDSIREMRPQGNRGVLVESEVGEKFGSGFDYMMLVLDEPSEQEALRETAEVMDRAAELVGDELISIDGITEVVPPLEEQAEARAWIVEHDEVFDPVRVERIFAAALQAEGLRFAPFEHGFDLYRAAVEATPVGLADLGRGEEGVSEGTASTKRLLERYLRPVGDGWKSVVYLYPPPRTWKREAPPGVRALAADLGDKATLTGVNLVSETLRVQVRRDAVVAAIVGFVLVALMLWADYRNPMDAALSLAPLAVGVVWMLGGMIAFGQNMNFFNIFVTTMIIGIGVDYGVHIMHRYHEEESLGADAVLGGLEETGKAIVLAAMSTSVGFGSMSLSHYPGLRSMGLVAIMGAVATCLVSITLLPAFLRLRTERLPDPSQQR